MPIAILVAVSITFALVHLHLHENHQEREDIHFGQLFSRIGAKGRYWWLVRESPTVIIATCFSYHDDN